MKAIKIPVEGEMEVVEVEGTEAMAEMLGCDYIERARVHDNPGRVMVIDEMGIPMGKIGNLRASVLYGHEVHGGVIHGDVLYLAEGWVDDPEDGPGVDFMDLKDADGAMRALRARFKRSVRS